LLRLYADGASDEQHLLRAESLGRVLLSADRDFLRLVHERHERDESHPGLVFVLPRTDVGDAVRAIVIVVQVLEPEDMAGWVEFVP
jgi:hypothetical protein